MPTLEQKNTWKPKQLKVKANLKIFIYTFVAPAGATYLSIILSLKFYHHGIFALVLFTERYLDKDILLYYLVFKTKIVFC